MSQQYSHRNGEVEPPTEKGCFWCRGPLVLSKETIVLSDLLTMAPWHDNTMLTRLPDGKFVTVGETIVLESGDWSACRWWGPAIPPWGDT